MLERFGAQPESKERESKPLLSVVIPTRNEIDNVDPLFDRLVPAMQGYHGEVFFC